MDIRTRIRDYVGHAVTEKIRDDDDIFEMGLVNSLFALQLVQFVESEFSISLGREDLDIANFCSISALTSFVVTKSDGPGQRRAGHDDATD